MNLSELLARLLKRQVRHRSRPAILWREIIGNGFGLASALLGMRRQVAAWPIGIVGNVLLFTVFWRALGGASTRHRTRPVGPGRPPGLLPDRQRLRLGPLAAVSRSPGPPGGAGVRPRWAGARGGSSCWSAPSCLDQLFYFVLKALGSWGPLADAWILTGSILATYGMARGWVEFWLVWIAVDAVGVPLLLTAGYYPSAIMYIIYGAFCVIGFVSWLRIERGERPVADPTVWPIRWSRPSAEASDPPGTRIARRRSEEDQANTFLRSPVTTKTAARARSASERSEDR